MPKQKFFLFSLFILLSSIAVHLYLSIRSYSIQAGSSLQSGLCQFGENWNCDVALTSDFSEILGIPISNFGFALNAVCLIGIILIRYQWLSPTKIWSDWIWRTALLSALGSVVMLSISFFILKKFCPGCVLLYVLSFLALWPIKKVLPSSRIIKGLSFRLSTEWIRPPLYIFSLIVFIVFMFHALSLQSYPIKKLKSTAHSNFVDWKQASEVDLSKSHRLLTLGPDSSKAVFTIVEFADFLCSHCKKAYSILKNFQNIHPEVRVELIGYPLNPRGCQQNEKENKMSRNCYLIQSVLCAENQKFGISLKDFIFENQQKLTQMSLEEMGEQVKNQIHSLNGDFNLFQNCIGSEKTVEQVSGQIDLAQQAKVHGTPTLFIEGKKLSPQAIPLSLEMIYQYYSSN